MLDISMVPLTHTSREFDAAYHIISAAISPEYLETAEFLRNRLRVRDEGPKTDDEKILLQDGYTLHLIAAKEGNAVVGAIYGHLISKITDGNKAVGFVTYVAVHPEHRRKGIGTSLIAALHRTVNEDARRLTGSSIIGIVYEIEEEGKEEIKAMVGKFGARPLDIEYYQPALRIGYEAEPMNLWFQPVPALTVRHPDNFRLDANVVHDLVRNMLLMEYVGPEMTGFDLSGRSYGKFLRSLNKRATISARR